MSSWATNRKLLFMTIFVLLVVIFAGVPTFFTFYKPATCSDGIQNQNEKGVDCGGKCTKLCAEDFSPVVYVWQRFVEVVPSVYNVLAYVENPNLYVESAPIPYVFRLYDKEGILITERKGFASVPAGKKFAIFESALKTVERVPARITFEFISLPLWENARSNLVAKITNIKVISDTETSSVEATVVSQSQNTYKNVEVVAIVYDGLGNAINFSKTIINNFGSNSTENTVFTWPKPFSAESLKVEILVRLL